MGAGCGGGGRGGGGVVGGGLGVGRGAEEQLVAVLVVVVVLWVEGFCGVGKVARLEGGRRRGGETGGVRWGEERVGVGGLEGQSSEVGGRWRCVGCRVWLTAAVRGV